MSGHGAFLPGRPRTDSVFLDTSGLFALFHPNDERHVTTKRFYELSRYGELPYQRFVTNDYVIDEVATLLRQRVHHDRALNALATVLNGDIYDIEFVTPEIFHAARRRFADFDDHALSFTDCTIVSHMDDLGLDHLLSFDDDFAAFDCTVIPHYVS